MLQQLMQWLGFGLCHQLPERSFIAGGLQLPVCARDTGIYLGFVISFVVIVLLHRRERPTGFPRKEAWIVIALLVAAMAWDGITSYAGFRSTTNDLRLATGLAMGFALAVVVVPILNDELWRVASATRVLAPAWRLTAWLATLPLAFALIRFAGPLLGAWYAVVSALAILATLALVNLVVVAMLPPFDRKAHSVSALALPVSIAVVVAIVEVWLAGLLRFGLLSLLA